MPEDPMAPSEPKVQTPVPQVVTSDTGATLLPATKQLETKPGYLTTEFWSTITLNVLGVVQLCTGSVDVNNKYVALAMAIVTGLYNGSRGLAKAGIPYKK